MFQVLKGDRRNVLAVRFAGSLRKVDLDRFTAWLERETDEQPDGSLLIVMDDFDGYRSLEAFVADLEADLCLKDRFTKIAVVGDADWERVMTALADPFSKASLRYYPEEQQGAALAWLRS